MFPHRVAVTGLGLMTGLGLDLHDCWQGILSRQSPAARFTLFDADGMSTPFGVELPSEADGLFVANIKQRWRTQMTRGTMMAVVTSSAAVADAGLDDSSVAKDRVGVVLGTTGTGYLPPADGIDDYRILRGMSSSPVAWISILHKYMGPSFVVGTACSSGAFSLASAFSLIESGQCDVVITGAFSSLLNSVDVQGFSSLMALAETDGDVSTASRPFDKNRNGFVIGEGAGILVLENAAHAAARGAHCYCYMSRPGLCSEAYNILSPQRGGKGMARSMQLALSGAGVCPGNIDYINAHGTSTYLNDMYEAQAIEDVFGKGTSVPVSSTKSMTGHCLAAAAAVEAVICCLSIEHSIIPPTINLTCPDPDLQLDFVADGPRERALEHVMSNSFGFGGHNGVCVFSKGA